MKYEIIEKESFTVLGRLGSTNDGPQFYKLLWRQADQNFIQVREFVKKNNEGQNVGFWGLMSDFSMSFKPWEDNFSKGYYLAGVECVDDCDTPSGWTKWVSPAYKYVKVNNKEANFMEVINFLKENKMELVGAVYDFTDPKDGENYMLYPIEKL